MRAGATHALPTCFWLRHATMMREETKALEQAVPGMKACLVRAHVRQSTEKHCPGYRGETPYDP